MFGRDVMHVATHSSGILTQWTFNGEWSWNVELRSKFFHAISISRKIPELPHESWLKRLDESKFSIIGTTDCTNFIAIWCIHHPFANDMLLWCERVQLDANSYGRVSDSKFEFYCHSGASAIPSLPYRLPFLRLLCHLSITSRWNTHAYP